MPNYQREFYLNNGYVLGITDIGVLLVSPGECMWIMFKPPMVKNIGHCMPVGFGHWVLLVRPRWFIGFIKPEHRVLRVSSIYRASLICVCHAVVIMCVCSISISLSKLVLSVDAFS